MYSHNKFPSQVNARNNKMQCKHTRRRRNSQYNFISVSLKMHTKSNSQSIDWISLRRIMLWSTQKIVFLDP